MSFQDIEDRTSGLPHSDFDDFRFGSGSPLGGDSGDNWDGPKVIDLFVKSGEMLASSLKKMNIILNVKEVFGGQKPQAFIMNRLLEVLNTILNAMATLAGKELTPISLVSIVASIWKFLHDFSTIEINDARASVFLACTKSTDETRIIELTKQIRKEYALHEINDQQIRQELNWLESMQMIKLITGEWHVAEEFNIRYDNK